MEFQLLGGIGDFLDFRIGSVAKASPGQVDGSMLHGSSTYPTDYLPITANFAFTLGLRFSLECVRPNYKPTPLESTCLNSSTTPPPTP
jgi:hypothetical protein